MNGPNYRKKRRNLRDLNIYNENPRRYMESDRGKGGTPPKQPKPLPKPKPTPPLTGCEFVSLGLARLPGFSSAYIDDAHIVYDPVNNSATTVLLKSGPDMNAMITANVPLHGGSVLGLSGACSKWGNIVTGCVTIIPQWGPMYWDTYVKFEVDPIAPDIFFHSYYVPDPVNPPTSGGHGNGACSVNATKDIVDGSFGTTNQIAGPGGADIYEITYHPTTSTWTDTLLFSLGPGQLGAGISMTGDMVYRPSDNTIFILCWDNGTNQGGVRHYNYNGTLIDEAWFPVTFGVGHYTFSSTMYCYDGDVYFLRGQGGINAHDIFRIDEPVVPGTGLTLVVVANPPTFNTNLPQGVGSTTGGDGATDSACCNPTGWTNPCLWFHTMMPYGYQDTWYHDPVDPNHVFSGQVSLPPPTPAAGLPTPPFAPVGFGQTPGSHIPIGTLPATIPAEGWFFYAELDAFINASVLNLGPTVPVLDESMGAPFLTHPSHVLMSNPTVNIDYENQSTLCEWCDDWGGSTTTPFNLQVTNWPLWIQNGWTTTAEAEVMCQCCPAVPPAGYVYPLPPEDPVSGLRGRWIPDLTFPLCHGLGYPGCL